MTESNKLKLEGTGAAYVRISEDAQDTKRQYEAIHSFEQRHGVKIAERFWFEDAGWKQHEDKERPDFNRLLKLAEDGKIQWVVVDHLDRFMAKRTKRFMGYLARLEDAGCLLYDVNGKEWTSEDVATELSAWFAGRESAQEQRNKSYRVLGGMVTGARQGEWQGGPPKLGFDVGCFDKTTNEELWRFVWEGRDIVGEKMVRGEMRPDRHIRRLKVFPDDRRERADGKVNFRTNEDTQVLRIVPTKDKTKLDAVKKVFERYATEAVSFDELAKWLNELGIRNSFGNFIQGADIPYMLADESYIGYPTFSKRRAGMFHRYDAEANAVVPLEPEKQGRNTASDIVRSAVQCYEPLVDRPTWEAVQRKLAGREKQTYTPKKADTYLAGIVCCARCGKPMTACSSKLEYYCSTWEKHRKDHKIADSPCMRNAVKQAVLEKYIDRYLEEVGKRLEILTGSRDPGHLTDRLKEQEKGAWKGFVDGMQRLISYLMEHHPEEYADILDEFARRDEEERDIASRPATPLPPGSLANKYGERGRAAARKGVEDMKNGVVDTKIHGDDFAAACVQCYRENFDSAALEAEIEQLDAQLDDMVEGWRDLPKGLAQEKAKAKLATIEERIKELRQQQKDLASIIEGYFRQMDDLAEAVSAAKRAMSEDGEQALRRKAEKLRGILLRIECMFVLTGRKTTGRGQPRARLAEVAVLPIAGDGKIYAVDGPDSSGGKARTNAGLRGYGLP